jgi:hypothetical protein
MLQIWFYTSVKMPPISKIQTHEAAQADTFIICLSRIMKHVMSSTEEVEVGSIFNNAKEESPLRVMLEDMGHPRPPIPNQMDNSTAYGILNNKVNQKRYKAVDMILYWVKD